MDRRCDFYSSLWFWMETWDRIHWMSAFSQECPFDMCVKEGKINWETHKWAHKYTVHMWSSKWRNHRKDHNTTQEPRIRDYSFWKKTHFLDRLCIFLHNSPTELLCIVISITLSARVVRLTDAQTLWLRSLLAFGRQAQHYVFGQVQPNQSYNWSAPSIISA